MGFNEFRRKLEVWGETKLASERPRYVNAFRKELLRSDDFERACSQAEPYLEGPLNWIHLLTRAIDVDVARQRLSLATALCGESPSNAAIPLGQWVVHQADTWLLCAAGFLERTEKLVISTCRQLVEDQSRKKDLVKRYKARLTLLRGRLQESRDDVAHGGGPVEELETLRLWEVHLALGVDGFEGVISQYHQFCIEKQAKWHQRFTIGGALLFRETDLLFDEVSKAVF